MHRIIISFIGILVLVSSCRPVKKVQTINKAITKKDTAQTVVIKNAPTIDSAAIVKSIMGKVLLRKIDFTTFNAKVKVDYEGVETSQHATAYISMKKDSVILLQLKGPFGIVGFQVKITNDSIVLINKVDKTIQYRTINYLKEITQIPFNFSTLQDVIIGNPIFIDSNVVSYKSNPNQLLVLMIGDVFKNLVTLDNNDFKVLHSKLDDINELRSRTCDITYNNYQPFKDCYFASYRQIALAEQSKLNLYLDFKEYTFNENLKYGFTIPKSYKKK